ncbi:hypothetical protein DB30_04947 [Enhygromyxa salina]|uniref:Lipoprotein n=1 Tax=Enhygromyxa salina TaxID=215803 RepID=A0A0C2D2T6_9BACT|nr:hypothetical protein [Enhygromyxa salina]KIG16075.1 hypothetical protein DB30_04947 [Enhygromyxa salina]
MKRFTTHTLGALAMVTACHSEPPVDETIGPCSQAQLERAAAELRSLPPERAGDSERLALESLYSSCVLVPYRLSLPVSQFGGEYVSPARERATIFWELSADERQVARDTYNPGFAALVRDLGWSEDVARSFTRNQLGTVAIGVDLLLRASKLSPRDSKTIAWAAYAHLGRAANAWPQVELARISARGADLEFHSLYYAPTHVHVATEGWSIGAWRPEPSPWLPVHGDWQAPTVSNGPPPSRIEPPKVGVVQMFVASDLGIGQLRGFVDAIPTSNCDHGDCSSFVPVDFVVVSHYHGPEFAQLVSLPIMVSSRAPNCESSVDACVVKLPVRADELSAREQLKGRARDRLADRVIVNEETIEVQIAGAHTQVDLAPEATLADRLDPFFAAASGPTMRSVVAVMSGPTVRWHTIATVVSALEGRECDVRQAGAPGCRYRQVALWVSE